MPDGNTEKCPLHNRWLRQPLKSSQPSKKALIMVCFVPNQDVITDSDMKTIL